MEMAGLEADAHIARDDYGITRVALFLDGNEAVQLKAFTDRTPESSGIVSFTPRDLGMSPGMTVTDWVAGPAVSADEPVDERAEEPEQLIVRYLAVLEVAPRRRQDQLRLHYSMRRSLR